jgi:hypothetical protein
MSKPSVLKRVVRPERLELPTLCSEGRCSIQLSYGRKSKISMLYDAVLQPYYIKAGAQRQRAISG